MRLTRPSIVSSHAGVTAVTRFALHSDRLVSRYTGGWNLKQTAKPLEAKGNDVFDSEFEHDLFKLRREKLQEIEKLGQAAYPNQFPFTHTVLQVRAKWDSATDEESAAADADEKSEDE